jgi:hypothetical protein
MFFYIESINDRAQGESFPVAPNWISGSKKAKKIKTETAKTMEMEAILWTA